MSDLRPTSETDPEGFSRRHAVAILRGALAQVPAKRQIARRAVANVIAYLEGRGQTIAAECHGAVLQLQGIKER